MLPQSKEITLVLGEGSIKRDKISCCQEQSKRSMKNFASFSSFSTVREEQDKDLVKATTSILTLSDEIVGLGGADIESTTLTSLSKEEWDQERMDLDRPLQLHSST